MNVALIPYGAGSSVVGGVTCDVNNKFNGTISVNLSKFNGVAMLGGVTLNGQQIYSEALSDIEKLETEIRTTYELNPALMMG